MLADDFAQSLVRKALLVMAERGGRVDAGEDGRLPRGALRAALDAEPRVRLGVQPAGGEPRLLAPEDGERRGLLPEQVERVVRPARADAEAVHEDE